MIGGFLLPHNAQLARIADKALGFIVLAILVLIGTELALVPDLAQKLHTVARALVLLALLTIGIGLFGLFLLDYIAAARAKNRGQFLEEKATTPFSLAATLTQFACLGTGLAFGFWLPKAAHALPLGLFTKIALVLLLLAVGVLLKNTGAQLKSLVLNRQGLAISAVFITITLVGGGIFAHLSDVPWHLGLSVAASFGWYSLSAPIITESYGAIWGSVALLNDLAREILALLFIPFIARRSPSAAIGLGGVTSLDFTLPLLQKSLGNEYLPVIMSFGFITNIVSPVLMVVFSGLNG